MLLQARDLPAGSTLEADLCIVGAGAAGITLARAFAGKGLQVALLESGGREFDDQIQALYQGTSVGLPYFPLDDCRMRYFGGTTNHWSGRCRPLDPIDFTARPWVPLSGWPFARGTLDPYYQAAHAVCQLGPYDYRAERWVGPDERLPAFDPAKIVATAWQYSPPTAFGEAYGPELEAAANIKVVLHANVLEILCNEAGGAVTGLRFATLGGQSYTARAKAYVLALGGLETPRLMLASNRQLEAGVGNQRDLVGRYFMEHASFTGGRITVVDPAQVNFFTDGIGSIVDGVTAVGCLNLSPTQQQARQLLNLDMQMLLDDTEAQGAAAVDSLVRAAKAGEVPDDFLGQVKHALGNLDDSVAALLAHLNLTSYEPKQTNFRLWCSAEQTPDPESRVSLGTELDAFGMPRLQLAWRLSGADRHSMIQGFNLLGEELGRLGVGRLQLSPELTEPGDSWPADLEGGRHHMGTTRMSDDPAKGVVDPNGQVHGLANLYVAGSSVFPTSGAANPTLTIVALTLRLAEHLDRVLLAS